MGAGSALVAALLELFTLNRWRFALTKRLSDYFQFLHRWRIRRPVIAATYQIRGCDAIYVALAGTLDEELITLDRQQGERAKSIKVYSW